MPEKLQELTQLRPSDRPKEYLSGGYNRTLSPLLANAIQVLSQFQDDLNKEFSDRVYEEMMRDPAVAASVDILKSLILSEPLRVVSKIQDKKDPLYEGSKRVADFVDRQLNGMRRSVHTVLLESLEAIQYGSSLVELVFEDAVEAGVPILKLVDLKTRNRYNYALLVDRYYNVLGAVSRESGDNSTSIYTGSTKPDREKVIPREKFLLLTLQGKNADPRGISMLRPAWNPYFVKSQVWPQYLKYLFQFASPSLVGYTPEEGPDEIEVVDELGNPLTNSDGTPTTKTPESDMLETLLGFQSGTVAVLKGGSKLDIIQSAGEGKAFEAAINIFDRQIAMAILKTHRTLLEAEHSSKADSESAADITDVFVGGLKEILSGAIYRDVVKTMVRINFGPEAEANLTPRVTLKSIPKQDFSKAADAIGKLWTAKYLHPSQVAETDAMVGLPERDMDAFLSELNEQADMNRLDQVERMKLMNPGAGIEPVEDKTPGEPEDA